MTNKATTLYAEVVDITYDYLGPAADRFVTRQIRSHLGKAPEHLKKRDLRDLISWIKIAMSLLTDDDQLISNYVTDLKRLAS
jgi:hypothetical protein